MYAKDRRIGHKALGASHIGFVFGICTQKEMEVAAPLLGTAVSRDLCPTFL